MSLLGDADCTANPYSRDNGNEERVSYDVKVTPYVVVVCLTAASGGLLFGYDLVISGGVSTMDGFLLKFFPEVDRKMNDAKTDNYCKFDSQLLTLFTSSLYFAGLITSFVASKVTRNYGRRVSIMTGGLSFLLGSVIEGGAQNLWMLLLGRIILGVGLGFTNQAVPMYLSEMAPPKLRGTLTAMFQLAIGIGGTSASLVNSGAVNIIPWGWRLSLSLAFVPALIVTVGVVILPDSPSSLIQRGQLDEGLLVLKRLRGTPDVQEEFNYLLQAIEVMKSAESPWKTILQRNYRPQLVMAFAIPFFQQVTGINIITFYLPILIETLGFGTNASLYCTIILGVFYLVVTIIGAYSIDKFGRRKVFCRGGSFMVVFLVLIGALLQWKLKSDNELSRGFGILSIILLFSFVGCFGWSWGPLAWLIPSEIFPLEIRSVGQSISTCTFMLFLSITAQVFLTMLCHLKAGVFYFFGGWVLIMTIFTSLLLPETKGVPLEDTVDLWKTHPFWKRYYKWEKVQCDGQ